MNHNYKSEPITKICEICDSEGDVEFMIDCPKYSEDIEKGIIPGWIHEGCCEEDFENDPKQCIEKCDNENLSRNILKYFEGCVNVEGLTKNKMREVSVYMTEGKEYVVTSEMGRLLESFKPLNIVTDVFLDKENGIIYIKDNQKNVNVYSLPLYEEVEQRLSSFEYMYPEKFCIKDGPLFLVYRYGDIVIGAVIAPRIVETDVGSMGVEVAKKYKERYFEAEEFFGVALQPRKEDLKAIIQSFSEDELINVVLCPLLSNLGFKGVKSISFHGPGESGGDFHPFYKTNEFGKIIYYSAQAKAVKIHSKSGVKEGNVNQLIDQIKKLFRTPFISFIDNAEKRISHAFILCSQDITPEAREQLFHEIENRQTISIVDVDDIVNYVIETGFSDQIFAYDRRTKKNTEK
jgi:hypothetical protein